MESINTCFLGICKLRKELLDQTSNKFENSIQHTLITSNEPESNNNEITEKPQLPENFHYLSPEGLENGYVKEFLKQHFEKPTNVEQLLDELQKNVQNLNQFHLIAAALAPTADLEPHNPSNGYRSMMKVNEIVIRNFISFLDLNKRPKVKKLRKQLYIIRLIVLVNLIQQSFRALSERLGHDNVKEPNLYHSQVSLLWMDLFEDVVPYLGEYFVKHLGFFLPSKLRGLLRFMARTGATIHNMPKSLVLPFSMKKMSQVAAKAFHNPNMRFPLGAFASLDDFPFRKMTVNIYHLKTPARSTTYFLPKQNQWILRSLEDMENNPEQLGFYYTDTGGCSETAWNHNKVIKSHKFGSKKNTIRVRILQHKSVKQDGTVLFHCHGGAFIFHSPDCHEIYLRDWVRDNPACTIFSVDYELRSIYPNPIQDVLDAYYWLTSGSEQVKQVLGFQPTKIVAAGDSAGAFLVYTLCIVLTDLNDYAIKNQLLGAPPVPHALVSIYGFYTLTNPAPIVSNSFLDMFLPASVIRIGFGALMKGCDKPSWNAQVFCHCCLPKRRPWYDMRHESKEKTKEVIEGSNKIYYLSSLTKFDFNRIQIPIFMITTEFDICMDHSIELARKWKGKGTLDVLEDLPHGFLQLNFIDDLSDKGCQLVMKRIKEAFNS